MLVLIGMGSAAPPDAGLLTAPPLSANRAKEVVRGKRNFCSTLLFSGCLGQAEQADTFLDLLVTASHGAFHGYTDSKEKMGFQIA
jgi:hypothetical protein